MRRVRVIDSHTEGEPTRVVLDGGPDLGRGSLAERRTIFRDRFDTFRSAIVNEPRGSDPMVGALVVPPVSPAAACGVIFFNNVGVLHGCGHGTIGLAATLRHLGRLAPGEHAVETPVGDVRVSLGSDGPIAVENVPSFRHAKDAAVEIEWEGTRRRVVGDVAWGGNWFFLTRDSPAPIGMANLVPLTAFAAAVRRGIERAGLRGDAALFGGEIDHIELFGPPARADCQSRNFVLCPGQQYDRSPCGTGTSAKVACLAADGVLAPGAAWGQESVIGSRFEASYRVAGDRVIPTIRGGAWVTAEATLLLDDADPFVNGIRV